MSAHAPFSSSARRVWSGWVLTGLLAVAATAAVAQTAPAADSHIGQMRPHDPARRQAMMAKREAEMKSALKITAAQEPAWTAFTTAMHPPAAGFAGQMSPEQRAEMDTLTTPERIDKMRAQRTQRLAQMDALADQRGEATKTFYAQLGVEQKSVFDAQFKKRMQHHEAHHGGLHKK